MELRHLRYFIAVSEALHFGRAARRLHISQPTVSQQIKQLEDELGARLFERKGAAITLTKAGQLFRAHATRALGDVSAGERAIRALTTLDAGELRIGYLPSLTTSIVVPAVSAVHRKYPNIRIVTEEGITRRIERRVADGNVDVGLGLSPSREPAVEAELFLESRLALVVPKKHPLEGEPKVSLRKLEGEPFALLSRGMRGRSLVESYFTHTRFRPNTIFEANAVAMVLAVVRAGLAVTVLPAPRFEPTERLSVIPLSPAPESHFAALLWRRNAPPTAAAMAFAEEVRALSTRGE